MIGRRTDFSGLFSSLMLAMTSATARAAVFAARRGALCHFWPELVELGRDFARVLND
jgi:hypothetical protein